MCIYRKSQLSKYPQHGPPIRDIELELHVSEIEDKLLSINKSGKGYPNLSRDKQEALHSLMNEDEIAIKPADKGSAIVIWSKKDYLTEASSQLKDTTVYQKCQSAPLQKINKEIKDILRHMLNCKVIDKKIMNYLIMKKPQLGRFYLLPKIHKRRSNVPGHPVISNNVTATENFSSFLNFHLKTIIPTIPHILEDTRDLLPRLNQFRDIPDNKLLVMFDAVGHTTYHTKVWKQ